MLGFRIGSKLLYTKDEKQFYRFNRKNKNGDAYLCAENGCKKRVHLIIDKLCIQQDKYAVHQHEMKEKTYKELTVLNEIKSKCDDINTLINEKKQSVRDIFYSVLSKHPEINLEFYKHERGLQMIRNSALPQNPLNCHDIAKIFERADIHNILGRTEEGDIFFDGDFEKPDCFMTFFRRKNQSTHSRT